MTDQQMKFVVIGTGNVASTYVSAIENIPEAEVVGFVSRNSRQSANSANIESCRSLQDLKTPFDAIIIGTPSGLHHEAATEAASLGKHVLCEKPLDITVEAMDMMIDSCRKNRVTLAVAYQRRFSSDNPVVKELLNENELGNIFSVDLTVLNYRADSYYNSAPYRGTFEMDGGGAFTPQASHYIDLYYWYFGRPEKIVSKLDTFVHDIEVEDHGTAILVHKSGMIGTITASTATKPGFPAKMEIYSDKGYLIMENDVITDWEIEGIENPTQQSAGIGNRHTGASSAGVDDTTNHENVIRDFIDSIRTGREPLITGESAKNATEMILEIYKNQI